jgi:recombinational DNA repair protein RecT
MNQAHLIPYNNKKTGKLECQFQPGYKGLERLTQNSGEVITVEAEVVRERDAYVYKRGLHEVLEHTPYDKEDAGEIIAAYAIATMRDRTKRFKWLWSWQIDKIKNQSQAGRKDQGPWVTHFDKMAEKTVKKALCRELPMSVEAQTAIKLDDLAEAGIAQQLDAVIPFDKREAPPSTLDELATDLDPDKEIKAESKVLEDEPAVDAAEKSGALEPETPITSPVKEQDDAPDSPFQRAQILAGEKKPTQDEAKAILAASDYDHIADNLGLMKMVNSGSFTKIRQAMTDLVQWYMDGKPGA